MDPKAGLFLLALIAWHAAEAVAQRPAPPMPPGGAEDGRPGDPPPPPPPPPDGPPPHPIFLAIDADGDGKLSAAEIARAADAIRALDVDKDGFVTEDEALPQGPPPPPPPPPGGGDGGDPKAFVESFLRFDKDGDGKVTARELPERMARAIEQGDANKDGALDRPEIEALARRPPPRRPPGPPRGDRPPPPPPRDDR